MGHIISRDGISVDPMKIDKIRNFPRPHSVKTLRQFLGLSNYYRKFICGYSHVAAPLTQLLHKDTPFSWTDEQETAFQSLRDELVKVPTLTYAKLNEPFYVHVDASSRAIGYCLTQLHPELGHLPIEFGGRGLSATEQKFSVTEMECLSLIHAIRVYHPYLVGQKFYVISDHIALRWLQSIRASSTGRLARWSLLLQGYTFEILHKPGKEHIVPDVLSRIPHPPVLPSEEDDVFLQDDIYLTTLQEIDPELPAECVIHYVEPQLECASIQIIATNQTDNDSTTDGVLECSLFTDSLMKSEQRKCPEFAPIINYLESDILPDNDTDARKVILASEQFVMHNGLLYHMFQPRSKDGARLQPFVSQLCVPTNLRSAVLKATHDDIGHAGRERSYLVLKSRFFWKAMYTNMMTHVDTCQICQQCKRSYCPTKAELHSLEPVGCFERWFVDYAGPLSVGDNGNKYLLLFVESLSGYPELIPVRDQTAKTAAKCLYEYIYARHGAPKSLVSDRGSAFLSQIMKQLCNRFQIKQVFTSAYHPQTNAKVERRWPMIWSALRSYCVDQNDWEDKIPSILYALRATPSVTTGFSPAFILNGRDLTLPLQSALTPVSTKRTGVDSYVRELLPRLELVREIARENVLKAQKIYKKYYDKTKREITYNPGDLVWLHQTFTPKGVCAKLHRRYVGPFYIIRRGLNDTYILRDSVTHKLQSAPVHVNRLRKHVEGQDMFEERFKIFSLLRSHSRLRVRQIETMLPLHL